MAKTQKFKDDLLLEAVIKYSEEYRGKIRATELAQWSRRNIVGLEDVRDYHFTRSVRVRDAKTGKEKEVQKLCTIRMNEINKSRSIGLSVKTNILLRSTKIDAVFDLPLSEQKRLVVETRETVDELLRKNQYLQRENDALRRVNSVQLKEIEQLSELTKTINKEQKKINVMINYILKSINEEKMREKLAEMGITDGSVDLDKYVRSISEEVGRMHDINKTLRKYNSQFDDGETDMTDFIMGGIDFD